MKQFLFGLLAVAPIIIIYGVISTLSQETSEALASIFLVLLMIVLGFMAIYSVGGVVLEFIK